MSPAPSFHHSLHNSTTSFSFISHDSIDIEASKHNHPDISPQNAENDNNTSKSPVSPSYQSQTRFQSAPATTKTPNRTNNRILFNTSRSLMMDSLRQVFSPVNDSLDAEDASRVAVPARSPLGANGTLQVDTTVTPSSPSRIYALSPSEKKLREMHHEVLHEDIEDVGALEASVLQRSSVARRLEDKNPLSPPPRRRTMEIETVRHRMPSPSDDTVLSAVTTPTDDLPTDLQQEYNSVKKQRLQEDKQRFGTLIAELSQNDDDELTDLDSDAANDDAKSDNSEFLYRHEETEVHDDGDDVETKENGDYDTELTGDSPQRPSGISASNVLTATDARFTRSPLPQAAPRETHHYSPAPPAHKQRIMTNASTQPSHTQRTTFDAPAPQQRTATNAQTHTHHTTINAPTSTSPPHKPLREQISTLLDHPEWSQVNSLLRSHQLPGIMDEKNFSQQILFTMKHLLDLVGSGGFGDFSSPAAPTQQDEHNDQIQALNKKIQQHKDELYKLKQQLNDKDRQCQKLKQDTRQLEHLERENKKLVRENTVLSDKLVQAQVLSDDQKLQLQKLNKKLQKLQEMDQQSLTEAQTIYANYTAATQPKGKTSSTVDQKVVRIVKAYEGQRKEMNEQIGLLKREIGTLTQRLEYTEKQQYSSATHQLHVPQTQSSTDDWRTKYRKLKSDAEITERSLTLQLEQLRTVNQNLDHENQRMLRELQVRPSELDFEKLRLDHEQLREKYDFLQKQSALQQTQKLDIPPSDWNKPQPKRRSAEERLAYLMREICDMLKVQDKDMILMQLKKLFTAIEAIPRMQEFIKEVCITVQRGVDVLDEHAYRVTPKDVVSQISKWIGMLQNMENQQSLEESLLDMSMHHKIRQETTRQLGELGEDTLSPVSQQAVEFMRHFQEMFEVRAATRDACLTKMHAVYAYLQKCANTFRILAESASGLREVRELARDRVREAEEVL